jgi:hypothetical protein
MKDVLKLTNGMSTLEILIATAVLTTTLSAAALMLFSTQDAVRAARSDIDAIAHTTITPPHAPSENMCGTLANLGSPLTHYDYPTASLPSGGMEITDIQVTHNTLYVAARSSVTGNTLHLFTLANSNTPPTYLGGIDNIPTVVSAGLSSIAVQNKYVYGANGYGANFTSCSEAANCAQLQIFDVQDPSNPRLRINRKVPGVLGSGGQGTGSVVVQKNGYLYLGLTKTGSGPEFHIFDVGANTGSSTNPLWLGSFTVGRTINDIAVIGNTVYLATDDSNRELIVLNVADKTQPKLSTAFNAPGTTNFGYGFSLAQSQNSIVFGRSYVSNAPELYQLTLAAGPLSSYDIGTSTYPDGVDALLTASSTTFAITNTRLYSLYTNTGVLTSVLSLASFGALASDRRASLACAGAFLIAAIPLNAHNQDTLSFVTTP